jgi:hypothetical protein
MVTAPDIRGAEIADQIERERDRRRRLVCSALAGLEFLEPAKDISLAHESHHVRER